MSSFSSHSSSSSSSTFRREAKKWCTYCKIFIGSNAADISHHEKGWRHKNNVQRYLKKQLVGGKKRPRNNNNGNKKKEKDNDNSVNKEPEIEFKHDVGYYVVDGRPYLEAEYHQDLLKVHGVLAEAVYPGTDDWLPITISHKNVTHLGEGLTEKVLVIFFTQENKELFIPVEDIRLPVAPPPPPRNTTNNVKTQLNDEGLMFSENKDTSTGLGMWKTTVIIESEEENSDDNDEHTIGNGGNKDEDPYDTGGGADDYVVQGTYRGVKLDDKKMENIKRTTNNNVVTNLTTNNYTAPDSIKAVSAVFKKRKKKKQRKGNIRKSALN